MRFLENNHLYKEVWCIFLFGPNYFHVFQDRLGLAGRKDHIRKTLNTDTSRVLGRGRGKSFCWKAKISISDKCNGPQHCDCWRFRCWAMWYSVDLSLFADVSNNRDAFSPWPSGRSDHDPSKLREPLAQHSRQSLASQKTWIFSSTSAPTPKLALWLVLRSKAQMWANWVRIVAEGGTWY